MEVVIGVSRAGGSVRADQGTARTCKSRWRWSDPRPEARSGASDAFARWLCRRRRGAQPPAPDDGEDRFKDSLKASEIESFKIAASTLESLEFESLKMNP